MRAFNSAKYLLSVIAVAAVFTPALFLGQNSRAPGGTGAPKVTDPTLPPATDKHAEATPSGKTSPGPQLSRAAQETFLTHARIVAKRLIAEGTTHMASRVTLTDGHLTHDAHIQTIDIFKPVFRGRNGTVERNFRDSWKYNVAAYRMDKMLSLNMVPVCVERVFNDRPASWDWWVDDVWMDEATRRDKGIKPPTADFWLDQVNKVRVFDQLIANVDRNQGNLLITHDWKLWMIDHSRAFRTTRELLRPDVLQRCDKTLLEQMRKLDRGALQLTLSQYLTPDEIEGILARRDIIVNYFDTQIREKGSDAVLTGIPRSTPVVTVP